MTMKQEIESINRQTAHIRRIRQEMQEELRVIELSEETFERSPLPKIIKGKKIRIQ